jgi:hypothetical protein
MVKTLRGYLTPPADSHTIGPDHLLWMILGIAVNWPVTSPNGADFFAHRPAIHRTI